MVNRKFRKLTAILFFILFLSPAALKAKSGVIVLDWATGLKSGRKVSKDRLNFASPLISGERVYVGNSGSYFYSLNLKNGKKIWEADLKGAILSQPAFDGVNLFVGDGEGMVYSINAENGEINWRAFVGEQIMAKPALDDATIYILTLNNSVAALDKNAGSIKWIARRPVPFQSMSIRGSGDPVIIDDNIYVGNVDGVLVVYKKADGKKLYTLPLAAGRGRFTDIDATPLKTDNKLILSTMEGGLYAVNPKSGKEYWAKSIATPNDFAYDGGRLYITSGDRIYCLNIEDGSPLWEATLEVNALSAPAVSAKYVALISTDDKLFILDKVSGEQLLERHLGGGSFGSPVISNNRVIVLANNGNVYAFRINK